MSQLSYIPYNFKYGCDYRRNKSIFKKVESNELLSWIHNILLDGCISRSAGASSSIASSITHLFDKIFPLRHCTFGGRRCSPRGTPLMGLAVCTHDWQFETSLSVVSLLQHSDLASNARWKNTIPRQSRVFPACEILSTTVHVRIFEEECAWGVEHGKQSVNLLLEAEWCECSISSSEQSLCTLQFLILIAVVTWAFVFIGAYTNLTCYLADPTTSTGSILPASSCLLYFNGAFNWEKK